MSDVVRQYYDAAPEREWARLGSPYRKLELVTTLHLVDRYFPPQCHVVDIGGGPGRYTAELLRRGFRVTLVDLSSRAVALAQERLDELGLQAERIIRADACDLSALPSDAFDGALCLGPLYHIVERQSRRKALQELKRVLRPGAPALVAFLNPWGILRAGITEFPESYRRLDHVKALLEDWEQTGEQDAFTEAVFLTPPSALQELREAGLQIISYAGAESFAAGLRDELVRMAEEDPEAYGNVLQLAAEACELPQYREATEHLHAVVRSPR